MKFENAKQHYASMIETYGATSEQLIAAGLTYSEYLVKAITKLKVNGLWGSWSPSPAMFMVQNTK